MSGSTTTVKQSATTAIQDERILVVKRDTLFSSPAWHGIKQVDFSEYLNTIQQHKEFLWRSEMEEDPKYKQIIPYLVFTHNDKYFLMQRRSTASEKRLQNKLSLGIGGHIKQEDLEPLVVSPSKDSRGKHNAIFNWARREFNEEVAYNGKLEIEPLGILNDDSNPVGQVHLGFVLLLKGDTDKIAVKSELKSGQLVSLDECKEKHEFMESWSQLVVDFLKTV